MGQYRKTCEGCGQPKAGRRREDWFDKPTLCDDCYGIALERPNSTPTDDTAVVVPTRHVSTLLTRGGLVLGDDLARHRHEVLHGSKGEGRD